MIQLSKKIFLPYENVLVFALNDKSSFEHVRKQWLSESMSYSPDAKCVLVGIDAGGAVAVSKSEIDALVKESKKDITHYVPCSLTDSEQVVSVIDLAINAFYDSMQAQNRGLSRPAATTSTEMREIGPSGGRP